MFNRDKIEELKQTIEYQNSMFEIYAKTTRDLEMKVWNGTHPVEENTKKHICKSGTKVRVWMVSRFGDVGVTATWKIRKDMIFVG